MNKVREEKNSESEKEQVYREKLCIKRNLFLYFYIYVKSVFEYEDNLGEESPFFIG